MVIGKTIYHCSKGKRGKPYRTYSSAAKAKEVHKAIMASKYAKALKRRSK